MSLALIAISYLALLISLVVHEFAHGFVAYLQGDHTAERMGRLTLDPRAHVDPIGTILLPLLAIITHFPIIGWAKPVPYNPYNLRNQKWGPTIVALAGPFSNFLLAAIFLFGLRFLLISKGLTVDNLAVLFLLTLAQINIVLGLFNLIPVPPLDGSKLLEIFLAAPKYRNIRYTLETKGTQILMLVIFIDFATGSAILGRLFMGAQLWAFSLFGLG